MILILGGTTEARKLSWLLADYDVPALVSLAGATSTPKGYPVNTRIGGFGGEDGFLNFVKDNDIIAVVDATHPFAEAITNRTARVCREIGLPYMQLIRPEWEPEPEDKWIMVPSLAEAAKAIPSGARVLGAVGRKGGDEITIDGELFLRAIDPQPERDGVTWIIGRPPFSKDNEIALLREHAINWIIAKNAGGPAEGKLLAARELGIPVVMVQRPEMPDAPQRERVQDVFDWIMEL